MRQIIPHKAHFGITTVVGRCCSAAHYSVRIGAMVLSHARRPAPLRLLAGIFGLTGRSALPGWKASLMLAVVLACLCGCASTDSTDSKSTGPSAMITLTARDEEAVRAALIDSFVRETFKLSFSGVHSLLFERRGSSMSTLLHGGWPGLDEPAWFRAKITIQATGDNAYQVTCDASRVQDKGENLFEEEKQLTGSKAAPFEKLLQRARDSLK